MKSEFLKQNYKKHGAKYCSDHLNRHLQSIRSKVAGLKLTRYTQDRTKISQINRDRAIAIKLDVMEKQKTYLTVDSPEKAYSLGFLWGMGLFAPPLED